MMNNYQGGQAGLADWNQSQWTGVKWKQVFCNVGGNVMLQLAMQTQRRIWKNFEHKLCDNNTTKTFTTNNVDKNKHFNNQGFP